LQVEIMHPTKKLLIETTAGLLAEFPSRQITSEQVLERSHVSKGSLYHHFRDLADLVEAAQVERFSQYVNQTISALTDVLTDSSDLEAARAKFHAVVNIRQPDNAQRLRVERMETAVLANYDARIRTRLNREQARLTNEWANLFQIAKDRGWANPDLDPIAVSIMMQATIAGRIVDDMSDVHMDQAKWVALIQYLLDVIFFVNR
jgi:AcrR family transcriptional regulator